jgi:DNA-binding SARP family transcriptional activator/tetratricopeptide (TPR) repeat protein
LGPVELWSADQRLELGPIKQRTVLAALMVDVGRPVSVETLIQRVWDEAPPAGARSGLYSYITRLRRVMALADTAGEKSFGMTSRPGGYVLEADPDRVDLHRFRRLADQAKQAGCDQDRAALLREAVALWRGEPLAGLTGDWVNRVRDGLWQQRLDVAASWAQAELNLGRQAEVVGVLRELVADHPLVEPLTVQLLRALWLDGRGAEALDCYAKVRRRLAEELGTEPGAELRQVHEAILRGDPDQARPAPPAVTPAPARTVPAQLPLDVYGFTGRRAELGQLDALLAAADEQPTAVVISALWGTAGVGKTALAVHWAHRISGRFPDGQLYANLRGYDPSGSVMTPAEAVRGFLDALGVPPERVPATPQAQISLYRSLLADKRVLVVLDNARDAEQVRPLLPGAPGCLVVVTSRDQLTGLVAGEGAQPVTLDLLSAEEARQLLARRLGRGRVAAEPRAVEEIIASSARLPLALAIVAVRAATHPHFPLATLAAELREARGGLDCFTGVEEAADVRAVFSWSYRTLSREAARLFRLLGLHPGPDLAAPAAASLAGMPPGRVRPLLAELARAHLLTEHVPGRHTFHDLLRAYATELVQTIDSDTDRQAARRRALDHYLRTAHAADRLIYPHRDQIVLTAAQAAATSEPPANRTQALAWFAVEHPVLLAAIDQAAAARFDAHAWQLAWSMATYLERRGHWHDWAATGRTALEAARRGGDRLGQAEMHRSRGRAYTKLSRHEAAYTHLQQALTLFGELGNPTGQALTHSSLSVGLTDQGRDHEALYHAQQAFQLYRSAGHQAGLARALNALGWCHAQLGDLEQAITYCRQAIGLHQRIGNQHGESVTWDSLGYAHHRLGHHAEAITCYQQAIDLYRQIGDRFYEAETLARLGDSHDAAGDLGIARVAWRRALDILDQLGHPDAPQVRAKIHRVDHRVRQ